MLRPENDVELKTLQAVEAVEYTSSASSSSEYEHEPARPKSMRSESHGGQLPAMSRPRFRLLNPAVHTEAPLIIFFHGSGDSCMNSWMHVTKHTLEAGYRVLLYDRSRPYGADLKAHQAVSELLGYLHQVPEASKGPYVLVAHSYGGCIARLFLSQRPRDVAGMVLAETGQETSLAVSVEREQYRKQILGYRPLSVIRGNSIRSKWRDFAHALAKAETHDQRAMMEPQRRMLEEWDAKDLKYKRAQLQLSKNSRFVQLDDVGHHVVRDRPEQVAAEIRWVMEELGFGGVGPVDRVPSRASMSLVRPATSHSIRRTISLARKPSAAGALKRGLSQRIKAWAGR